MWYPNHETLSPKYNCAVCPGGVVMYLGIPEHEIPKGPVTFCGGELYITRVDTRIRIGGKKMNRKHSFLTRCLAMLLVLVLVASNVNFTAFAAETSEQSLLAMVAQNIYCGTPGLRAVLAHASALKNLEDETVTVQDPPTAEEAGLVLREDPETGIPYLTAKVAGEWTPFYNDVDISSAPIALEPGTYETDVIYRQDVADAADQLALIAKIADEVALQAKLLDDISGQDVRTALNTLDLYFIEEELLPVVDEIDAEILKISVEDFYDVDLNEDGVIDDIDKELAPKALEAAVELAKKDFTDTINVLKDRIDLNATGRYQNRLYLYAMLNEYNKNGLPYFYANADVIIPELKALSDALYTVVNADANALAYLLDQFKDLGDALSIENLTELASRMDSAANDLGPLTQYKAELDLGYADLAGLCEALIACGNELDTVSEYPTGVSVFYKMHVVDDSWKYIVVNVNGNEIRVKFATDTELKDEDIVYAEGIITSAYKHYTVKLDELYNLIGTKMTADVAINCPATAIEYPVFIRDQEGEIAHTLTVTADDPTITLPCDEGHKMTYTVNGELNVITAPMTVEVNLDEIADLIIVLIEDFDIYKDDLETLVRKLNEKLGEGSVSLIGEDGVYTGLVANINLNDMGAFGTAIYESGYEVIKLNNKIFFYYEDSAYQISLQALIEALLNDETFTSDKLIAMGNGENCNLLTTTMQIPGYNLEFVLNLKSVPEQMTTVSKGLNAIKDYFEFKSNNGELAVNVNLPEKVYEAYLAAALVAGRVDDDNVEALNHEVAMMFVADCFELYMNSDVTTATYENTLALIGKDVDLSDYEKYHAAVKRVVTSDGFQYEIEEQKVTGSITGTTDNLEAALALFGINMRDLTMGLDIVADETLAATAVVNIVSEVPDFQAAVLEPGKLNDAGYRAKLSAADFTTDVVARVNAATGHVVVVLLDDVNGSLNFPKSAILDLNGNTVNGNVTANGTLIIVDSSLDTYHGGAVTGSVSAAKGAITGGTYGSDVSAFLKDGYYQDNGSVRNALYYMSNSNGTVKTVLNANFYEACDGYLPSVKALAVEIAADVAMAYYPVTALSYEGTPIVAVNVDEILDSYLGDGREGAIDALITDVVGFIHADGINALANDIIDDLCDFGAMAEALENGTSLFSYNFTCNTLTVDFVHNTEADHFDISIVPTTSGKTATLELAIDDDNKYLSYTKDLLAAMADIVIVDAGVELVQPTYDEATNTLNVAGSAYADVTFDFSADSDYTKGLAIILAYGNPDKAEELMAAMPCVVNVNKVIAQMTVEEVFTALKVMSRDVDMAAMAEAVGYAYTVEEIADMEKVYHVILCGIGAGLEKLDITGNSNTLDTYLTGDNTYSYGKTYDRIGDATVKGYTGVFEVTELAASLTIKLAPQCTKIIGDVNSDGIVDIFDAALLQRYCTKLATEDELHLCVADVNADGLIDIFDAAMIQRYCTNLIDSFPAEAK